MGGLIILTNIKVIEMLYKIIIPKKKTKSTKIFFGKWKYVFTIFVSFYQTIIPFIGGIIFGISIFFFSWTAFIFSIMSVLIPLIIKIDVGDSN